jgi:DNA-binding transcriptional ArsR family regulator
LSATTKTQATEVVDHHLVKALAHPLRAQILAILNERVASPNQLSKELDEALSNVSYHITVLKDHHCIEMVKTEQRRGAIEHFYRGTTRSFLSDANWSRLSPAAQNGLSVAGMKMIVDRAMGALEANTFDSRNDRHLSCTPMAVDDKGWTDVTALLNQTLEDLMEIQAESAKRLEEAGEDGTPATVSLISFESPAAESES